MAVVHTVDPSWWRLCHLGSIVAKVDPVVSILARWKAKPTGRECPGYNQTSKMVHYRFHPRSGSRNSVTCPHVATGLAGKGGLAACAARTDNQQTARSLNPRDLRSPTRDAFVCCAPALTLLAEISEPLAFWGCD